MCVYTRRVKLGSVWPIWRITETGSSPQATRIEAKAWRSLWLVSPRGSGTRPRRSSSSSAPQDGGEDVAQDRQHPYLPPQASYGVLRLLMDFS